MKHIKRRLWTLFLACLLMLGGTLLTAAAPLADTKWQILCQTNNNRIANGQVPLSAPYELCDLADIRAWELTNSLTTPALTGHPASPYSMALTLLPIGRAKTSPPVIPTPHRS